MTCKREGCKGFLRGTKRRQLLFESLEHRWLLASNLRATDAFLRDDSGNAVSSPTLGERIAVQVNYETEDLPSSAEYRIDFIVDGVTLDSGMVAWGAGLSFDDPYHYQIGWYAEPGTHTVEVVLDAGGDITESDETDNMLAFEFTSVQGTPPSKFIWPVEGTLFVDHTISNYVDVDPLSGIRDFNGGIISYDRHDALDIGTGNYATMDAGIEIYAAADGVVSEVHDGEFDRWTEWQEPAPPANYVIVDHGLGWRTLYWHLRRDSVNVSVGDQLEAGDLLGLMGSSGRSSLTHLHFEVQHNLRPVETMFDPNTYWLNPPGYVLDRTELMYSGVTNHYPTSHRKERPSDVDVYSDAPNQTFRAWAMVSGLEQTDTLRYTSFRPDGSVYSTGSVSPTRDYGRSRWPFPRTLPATPDLGTWRIEFAVNGQFIGEDFFEVTPNGAPEIRVDDTNGDLILDERHTPVDLGTVGQGVTHPSMTFTVVNHGSDTLTLGEVSVPDGFVVSEGLGTSLAAGATDTFTIELVTDTPGYFAGQVRVANNDANESDYNFSVEGTVTAAALDILTIGISKRSAYEGQSLVANVSRSGSTSQPLTVTLTSGDPSKVGVPNTVTIPAGENRASFALDAIQGTQLAPNRTANVLATATGYASAQNTLQVRESAALTLSIVASSISENGGATTATVSRNTDTIHALTVTLSSSDPGEATVPATITIPAGQSVSAPFSIDAVDDAIVDGTQTVTLSASAAAHADGSDTLDVTDVGTANAGVLDVSSSGNSSPFQDGILIVRYMLGQPDANLEDPTLIPAGSTRTIGVEIRTHLETAGDALDANGDGTINPFQDGILIVRFLLGQPDANLENPALIPAGSTRTTGAAIRQYLETLMPPPAAGKLITAPSVTNKSGEGELASLRGANGINDDGSLAARDAERFPTPKKLTSFATVGVETAHAAMINEIDSAGASGEILATLSLDDVIELLAHPRTR